MPAANLAHIRKMVLDPQRTEPVGLAGLLAEAGMPRTASQVYGDVVVPEISVAAPLDGGRIKAVGRDLVIFGGVEIAGQRFETAISMGSFNKEREAQDSHALDLASSMAPRQVSRAYSERLLNAAAAGRISEAGIAALCILLSLYLRDAEGGFCIHGSVVVPDFDLSVTAAYPRIGAFYARDLGNQQTE